MKSVSIFLMVLFFASFFFTFTSPAAQYGPEVYQVQKALKSKGYDPGPLDGLWGRSTRNAIEQFQRDAGLPMTGMLDQQTKSKLGIISSDRGIKAINETKERRIALVIGNGDYKHTPLKNPVNDALDMSDALRGLGFEVNKRINASQEEMEDAIFSFSQRLKKGGVGLFYFAGHGVQVIGRNYLIPVGATIRAERDVKYKAVDAGLVTDGMYDAGNGLNIVLLDACRDNPFPRSSRTSSRGLARMDASTGTFIAYATAPGAVAADGTGRNGIFTKHLLKNLNESGLKIEDVLKRARNGVMQETGNKQVPWQVSSLTGDFYFASSGAIVDKPATGASLSVESNIKGAGVSVDGHKMGTTPLSDISLSAGKHVVLVEKPGYENYQKPIVVESGRSVSLYVHMSASVKQTSRLFVDTEPEDAAVHILNIGTKFHQGIELETGRYQLEISADGWETQMLWVTLGAGEVKNVAIRLEKVDAGVSEDRFTNSLGMEFVYIPPDTFIMGSPYAERDRLDDERQHEVTLTRGFYIQTKEVTQGQWKAVMGDNPSWRKGCGDNCPVERVPWIDVQEFIRKLNRKEGTDRYRLPTEAEWEYAARAGTRTSFSFGNDPNKLDAYAWYKDNSYTKTHPVGQKKPNAWGLYDMHGNVNEWCQDWLGDYPSGSVTNPRGPSSGRNRVIRGGHWFAEAQYCRSANRNGDKPGDHNPSIGFRLARSVALGP